VANPVDKRALLASLHDTLAAELERASARAREAVEAATHEENRPESDKDMRSTEAAYVARGHAERVRELEHAVAKLAGLVVRDFAPGDPIAVSALVELDGDGRRWTYLLVPAPGGERIAVGATEVKTLTTASPLGAALLGLAEGDEVEVATPHGVRAYVIERVR
jgi:transcription elongation GreA/GreB family factor